MTGGEKPGEAMADKARDEFDRNRREREIAIERLKVRAEIRSSPDEDDEDTGVINLRAEQRVAKRESLPAAAKGVVAVLGGVKGWAHVAALAILVAGLLAAYWLKTR
jgi:hypothetical protein